MSEFERLVTDSMIAFEACNNVPHEDGLNLEDCEWDPIMGDADDYPETDDEWLDDFQGEEDWA